MTEKEFPHADQPEEKHEDLVAEMRANITGGEETAPTYQKFSLNPRELSSNRLKWTVRGLIGLLAVVLLFVGYLWIQTEEIRETEKYVGGPAVESYPFPPEPIGSPMPEVEEPPQPDELIAANAEIGTGFDGSFAEPPTTTPIPLPDDVPEIPFPTSDN